MGPKSGLEQKWMNGLLRVNCLTWAFGMGLIDNINITFVIHFDSLEQFYHYGILLKLNIACEKDGKFYCNSCIHLGELFKKKKSKYINKLHVY